MLHGYDGYTHETTGEVLSNNIYLPVVLNRDSLLKARCVKIAVKTIRY